MSFIKLGEEREFTVLNVLEFNSVRKRMSVILRENNSGKIKLFCKGADNIILERLDELNAQFKNSTLTHLEDFAKEGFRTLCIAYKEISEEEYRVIRIILTNKKKRI